MNKHWQNLPGGASRQLQVSSSPILTSYAKRMGINIVLGSIDELTVLVKEFHGQVHEAWAHPYLFSKYHDWPNNAHEVTHG